MSQGIRPWNLPGRSTVRLIRALSITSPLVLLQCSAQRNLLEVVRPLEDKHIGIATIDGLDDNYRVRWVSFTSVRSWGAALEGVRASRVRISPHGDRFVVSYSVPYGESGLLIANLMGKELWRMPYESGASALGLSADGSRLAFQSHGNVSYVTTTATGNQPAKSVELKSSGRRRDQLSGDSLGWSPDSTRIVCEVNGRVQIWNLNKGSVSFLAEGHDPTWSPDGHWIAYRATDNRPMLIDPSTGQTRGLRAGQTIFGSLRWSPDSRYLLFNDNHGNFWTRLLDLTPIMGGRLGVYDLATNAELIILDGFAVGDLTEYG